MADALDAEIDSFWDSFMHQPKSVKSKKKSKKNKDLKKTKQASAKVGKDVKPERQKHKKSKDKEKKRKKVTEGLQDVALFSPSSTKSVNERMRYGGKSIAHPSAPGEDSNKLQSANGIDDLTQIPKNTSKRKKKVAFDLSPRYIAVRRPKATKSCSSVTPINEPNALRDQDTGDWRLVQGFTCGQRQTPEDSQSTVDDANSEDLFITQKTFKVPSSETSSSDVTVDPSNTVALTNHSQPHQESQLSREVYSRPTDEQTKPEPTRFTLEAATQTENFFTTELSRYLSFHLHTEGSTHQADLQPVDLSLPYRSRALASPHPLISVSGVKAQEISPALGSRSSDMTSSEDNDLLFRSKVDLTQMKAVQMRLNESFFFKMKGGGGLSPRPQSPLMKLKLSRAKKPRN